MPPLYTLSHIQTGTAVDGNNTPPGCADVFIREYSGMLVVNVTWRNRSYVGTLLDASRHDWAPPR